MKSKIQGQRLKKGRRKFEQWKNWGHTVKRQQNKKNSVNA